MGTLSLDGGYHHSVGFTQMIMCSGHQPCDRKRMDGDKLEALLAETISIAMASGAISERQFERVTIDTTVQTKAVTHPTDSHLMLRTIEWLNRTASAHCPKADFGEDSSSFHNTLGLSGAQ